VGATITSDNLVISTGFNGLARGINDDEDVYDNKDEKLRLICHAEFNAIMNASQTGIALKGASIYVTKFPCLTCWNAIIQAGIEKVYTEDTEYWKNDPLDGQSQSNPHSRTKELIRQSSINVVAPNHPDFESERKTQSENPMH
jgi:dCMP deaminase